MHPIIQGKLSSSNSSGMSRSMRWLLPWTLVAALPCALIGCDDSPPQVRGEIDLLAAAEVVERDPEAAAPALHELVLAEPTVRDIVEGRIDAPKISASFGRVDESGEVTELCPQQAATLSGEPVDQARDIQFDATDPLLLDTPLSDACIVVDRVTGEAQLTRCDSPAGAGASASADDISVVRLDSAAYQCYFCTWQLLCLGSWQQKKMGWIVDNQCVAWGFFGCC